MESSVTELPPKLESRVESDNGDSFGGRCEGYVPSKLLILFLTEDRLGNPARKVLEDATCDSW